MIVRPTGKFRHHIKRNYWLETHKVILQVEEEVTRLPLFSFGAVIKEKRWRDAGVGDYTRLKKTGKI